MKADRCTDKLRSENTRETLEYLGIRSSSDWNSRTGTLKWFFMKNKLYWTTNPEYNNKSRLKWKSTLRTSLD
jgi:hypothetical protein